MPKMTKISLPLHVYLPRKTKADKKFILNLNNFRNAHHQILNQAKEEYEKVVKDLAGQVVKYEKALIYFVYYHPTRGRVDKSNPCSIIEKFACDALTKMGFWEDDDSTHIPWTISKFGGVDKENPRCDMYICEMVASDIIALDNIIDCRE